MAGRGYRYPFGPYPTGWYLLCESQELAPPSDPEAWPGWLEPVVDLTRNLTAMPLVGGNSACLLDDYAGSLDAMVSEIDAATTYVHVEF